MTATAAPTDSGYAPVNGLRLYFESHGEGGTPLILLHGGFGLTGMFGDLPARLSEQRRVVAVDLQGHGRTADIDRPLTMHAMADDIASLIGFLELGRVDVMGYSLGGGVALRTAIQHPDLVRKLVLVSTPFRKAGWYPDVGAQMGGVNRSGFEMMRQTPMFAAYAEVAPNPDAFPDLMDKVGALLGPDYDWTDDVKDLTLPTLLIYGDADSISPSHATEFFGLLGGGHRDGGWDGSGKSSSRLAVLPDTTHYDIFRSPLLARIVPPFLAT